jgi:hypothetical protein
VMHRSLRPGKAIVARFSGSVAPYPFSAVAECYNGDVIRLRRRIVNNPNPAMMSERVVL